MASETSRCDFASEVDPSPRNDPSATPSRPTTTSRSATASMPDIAPAGSAEPVLSPMEIEEGATTQENAVSSADAEPARVYIKGWRLYVLGFSLCLSIFLSTIETTIVSTSLVSITNALGGFEQRDWVVTSYLITYTGFLVIFAKFSDILGRKLMLLIALAFFTVFSIVCGSISNMVQLIVFRALQGVGGSGIYSLVTVCQPELVPPESWGNFMAILALVFTTSSVLGPILGGIINDAASGSEWRWVFLLNAPAGAIATALIAFFMPTHFPNQGNPAVHTTLRTKLSRDSLSRLDVIGATILVAATVLIVFAFEEAGTRYPWTSAAILSTIILGAVGFVVFVIWEHRIGEERSVQEPVFPLRLMKSRIFAVLIAVGFLMGLPFMTVLINLPQRFQAVDGATPFEAGIHLLPMLLCSPVATALAGQLASRFKVPPLYLVTAAAALQTIGIGLASTEGYPTSRAMYGYEVLMGFGFGLGLVSLLIYIPLTVARDDMAVSMGAITQIRVLGGTIGLAISATVLNNHILSALPSLLKPEDIQQISTSVQYISTLPDATRDAVRQVFSEGYNEQFRIMTYFNIAVFVCCLMLCERKPRNVSDAVGY